LLERDTVDRGEDVDAVRRVAELHDQVRTEEVALGEPDIAEPEVDECLHHVASVGRVDHHPHIEISGVARGKPSAASA
jgi:hypothetical protein